MLCVVGLLFTSVTHALYYKGGKGVYRLKNPEPGHLVQIVYGNNLKQTDDHRVLVIFDGQERESYDFLRDKRLSGGETRKRCLEVSDFDIALNVADIDDALHLLSCLENSTYRFDRIYIVDHGAQDKDRVFQTLGDEFLTPKTLGKLGDYLSDSGDLCLYGCNVGQNYRYLSRISDRLDGRKVWAYAATIYHDVDEPIPLMDPEKAFFFSVPFE